MEVDENMNSFKSYLSDYLVNKGRYYLPDKEDYSIKVLGNNEINDYFDKIDMSKFSLDQIRKSNTFGMTMFARNTKIFKQFNDKVGCIIIFIDRIKYLLIHIINSYIKNRSLESLPDF